MTKQENFINRANTKHNNKYMYDKVQYTTSGRKITITCPVHGDFLQEANSHVNKGYGCPECGKDLRVKSLQDTFNTDRFISKSVEIHKDTYEYSLVVYLSNDTPVSIVCPAHGVFEQKPRIHIAGGGCPECAKANNYYWSYSGWTKAGEVSKYFEGYKVYIVKLFNATEEFYKIGKTYNPIWLRFSRGCVPYEYVVLKSVEGSGDFICRLEEKLLKMNYKYRYTPEIYFAGSKECFSSIKEIEDEIDGY